MWNDVHCSHMKLMESFLIVQIAGWLSDNMATCLWRVGIHDYDWHLILCFRILCKSSTFQSLIVLIWHQRNESTSSMVSTQIMHFAILYAKLMKVCVGISSALPVPEQALVALWFRRNSKKMLLCPRADYAVACGLSSHSEQVESFLIHTKLRNTCSWFLNGHHETGTTKSWRKEVSHVQNIQQLLLRGGSKWNSFQFSNAIILTKQRRIQFRVEVLHIVQKWSLLHFFASDDIAPGVPCDTVACLLVRLTEDSDDISLLKAFAKFLNIFEVSTDCSISRIAATGVIKYCWGTTEADKQSEKHCSCAYQIMLPWDPGGVKHTFKNFFSSAWGQANFQGRRNVMTQATCGNVVGQCMG